MKLIDDELQAKIDKLDSITQDIGTDLFGAVSNVSRISEVFPIQNDGDKPTGEQSTQGQSQIQKSQASSNSEA